MAMNNDKNRIPRLPGKEKKINPLGEPGIAVPAMDPPVPNRAWTEMRLGKDIDELSEEEKADLYLGRDSYF